MYLVYHSIVPQYNWHKSMNCEGLMRVQMEELLVSVKVEERVQREIDGLMFQSLCVGRSLPIVPLWIKYLRLFSNLRHASVNVFFVTRVSLWSLQVETQVLGWPS